MNCMVVALELTPLMFVDEVLTAKGGPHRTGPPSAATTRGSLSTSAAASSCTCALAAAALRTCPATACKPAPKSAPAVRPSSPSPNTGFSSADMSGSRSLTMRCGGGSSLLTSAFGSTFFNAPLRVCKRRESAHEARGLAWHMAGKARAQAQHTAQTRCTPTPSQRTLLAPWRPPAARPTTSRGRHRARRAARRSSEASRATARGEDARCPGAQCAARCTRAAALRAPASGRAAQL